MKTFQIILFSMLSLAPNLVQASPLVIDGRDAKKNEYPAVTSIELYKGNGMSLWTATFISDNTLLTAAHCVYGYQDDDIILPKDFKIKKILIHEAYKNIKEQEKNGMGGYEYLKIAYDMALIVMDGSSSNVYMKTSTSPKPGSAIIVGYGGKNLLTVAQMNQKTDESIGIKRIGKLYIEEVNTLGRIDSSVRVFNARHWYSFTDMYSAAYGEKTSITSRGDSGGPLIQNGKVVGVISSTDATQQDATTVYNMTAYFAGLHSGIFADLCDEAKKAGSSIWETGFSIRI